MSKPAVRLGDLVGHAPQEIMRLGPAAPAVMASGAAAMTAAAAMPGTVVKPVGAPPKIATGAIVKGSTCVSFDKRPAAHVTGSIAPCAVELGAPIPVKKGSSTVFVDGRAAARLGDPLVCKAAILSGSSVVSINDKPKFASRPKAKKTLQQEWAEKTSKTQA